MGSQRNEQLLVRYVSHILVLLYAKQLLWLIFIGQYYIQDLSEKILFGLDLKGN
jgi:hypothetical protein